MRDTDKGKMSTKKLASGHELYGKQKLFYI